MNTIADLAWAAGAIDGEGCIQLHTYVGPNSTQTQYVLYLDVGNTDPRMPAKLADMFGGKVYLRHQGKPRRPIYSWRIHSRRVAEILKEVRPYLVLKGEQADVALAFAATIQRTGGHTAEVREARNEMKKTLALLKREAV